MAVILYFAALICRFRGRMRTFRYGIAPFAAVLLLIVGLLVLEPHFSAAIIIIAIGAVMLFLAGRACTGSSAGERCCCSRWLW